MADPILDFLVIDTHDLFTIGLADTSVYPQGFVVQSPAFWIKPGDFEEKTVAFNPRALTIYNSKNLGFCSDDEKGMKLPDGLYKIRMTVYPNYSKEKTILRVDGLQEAFDEAFVTTDMMQCDQDIRCRHRQKLETIHYYIQCAIAAANKCAYPVAIGLYHQAQKLLHDFKKQNA